MPAVVLRGIYPAKAVEHGQAIVEHLVANFGEVTLAAIGQLVQVNKSVLAPTVCYQQALREGQAQL